VQLRPNLNSKWTDGFANGQCTTNSAGRSLKGDEEAVARCVDLAAAEALELLSYRPMVTVEQVAPPAVAECGGPLG